GITVDRIVDVVGNILTYLRYVDIELTFDAICELFPDAQTDEERKHLLTVAERLAQQNLDVWKQAGPYVQTVLVQKIRRIDDAKIDSLRPVLLEILGEALKTELHGVTSNYRSVTLRKGAAVASEALARMRAEAINLLMKLYRTASTDIEKRRTESALFEATRMPGGSGRSNKLVVCFLDNAPRSLTSFRRSRRTNPTRYFRPSNTKCFGFTGMAEISRGRWAPIPPWLEPAMP